MREECEGWVLGLALLGNERGSQALDPCPRRAEPLEGCLEMFRDSPLLWVLEKPPLKSPRAGLPGPLSADGALSLSELPPSPGYRFDEHIGGRGLGPAQGPLDSLVHALGPHPHQPPAHRCILPGHPWPLG